MNDISSDSSEVPKITFKEGIIKQRVMKYTIFLTVILNSPFFLFIHIHGNSLTDL